MNLGMVHEWMHADSATFTLRLVCGISAVWLTAALATIVLRRSSAALRHRVWSLSIAAALILPALVAVMPEWRVGAISLPPAPEAPAAQTSAAIVPATPVLPERAAGQAMRVDLPPVEMPPIVPESPSAPPAAHPISPPAAEARPVNWAFWIGLAWLIPAFGLILWQAAALLAAHNLVRRSAPLDDGPGAEHLSRLVSRLGIARPRLLESAEIGSPICLGCWRPAILLPVDWKDWLPAQLEAVLTHELAHVARRDVLWQLLARLACALYWLHPLAWVAVWRLRVERELACDDWVLRGGESSTRYARWLLEAATRLLGREPHAAERIGVAMAARSGFEKRIRAILDPHRRRFPVSRPMAVILALAAAAILGAAGMLSPLAAEKVGAGEAQAIATTQPLKKSPKLARISGRVEDEDGRPVGGVIVECDGPQLRHYSTRTDSDGRFGLEVEPRRYQTVQVSTPDRTKQAYRVFEDAIEAGQVTDLRLVLRPAREFAVTVNDAKGLPVAGAWVAVNSAHRIADEATTDTEGRALLRMPPDAPPMYLIAGKPDVGLDYVLFWRKGETHIDPYRLEPDHRDPVTLVLDGTRTVKVRVVDEEERPLPGVSVYPWYVQRPRKGNYANTSSVAQFRVTTDEHGIAALRMIPFDNTCTINFRPTREGYCAPKRGLWDPKTGQTEVTVQLLRQVPVTGRVVDTTGRPVGGARVRVSGAPQRDDRIDGFRGESESAEDGTFQIEIDPDMRCLFVAAKDRMATPAHVQMINREAPAAPIELVLAPAVRVHGRVVVGPERTPYPGAQVTLSQEDERPPLEKRFSDGSIAHVMSSVPSVSEQTKADERGRFAFYIGPGKYGVNSWIGYGGGKQFKLSEDGSLRVLERLGIEQTEQVVKASPEGFELDVHVATLPQLVPPLKGRVVLRDKPDVGVAEVMLTGIPMTYEPIHGRDAVSDGQGHFSVVRGKLDFYLHASTADRKLQGMARVTADDVEVTVPVGPTASISGRMLDEEGNALAHRIVMAEISGPTSRSITHDAIRAAPTTGADGSFMIDGLVPGFIYDLSVALQLDDRGIPRAYRGVTKVKAERPERMKLGDVMLTPIPVPKTFEEYAAEAFSSTATIDQRLAHAQQLARRSAQRVLVILGGPGRAGSMRLFQYWHDNEQRDVWFALGSYAVVSVNASVPDRGAPAWAERVKARWPADGTTLAVLDADGRLLAQTTDEALSVNGALDRQRLLNFLKQHAPTKPDARQLIDDALAKAKRDGKNILLEVGGPYCGPCKLLGAYIEANRALLEKDFVHVKIDQDFLNHQHVVSPLRVKSFSIPWMAILSPDGRMIINSDGPNGNIGYFSGEEGKAHWEKMLRAGAKRLTEAEIRQLVQNTSAPLSAVNAPETVAVKPQAATRAAAPPTAAASELVRFSGRVEDEAGRVLAGAVVEVSAWPAPPRSVRTTADGRFAIETQRGRSGKHRLHARTSDGTQQGMQLVEFAELGNVDDLRLVLRPARELAVTVKDVKGQPIAGAWVASVAHTWPYAATSDTMGRALLRMPADAELESVLADKPDVGLDYALFRRKDDLRSDPYRLDPNHRDPIALTLNGATAVRVRVVDAEQRPLEGVRVYPWLFTKPMKGGDLNISALHALQRITDKRGSVEFRNIPADNTRPVIFWPRLDGYCVPKRCIWDPKSGQAEVTVQMLRQIQVRGSVVDTDRRPVGGAIVRVSGRAQDDSWSEFHGSAVSAEDGSFHLTIDPNMRYLFVASHNRLASMAHVQMIGAEAPADPIKLVVQPATQVHGNIVVGPDRAPSPGASILLVQRDDWAPQDVTLPGGAIVRGGRPSVSQEIKADEQGRFDAWIAPGEYQISCNVGMGVSRQIELGDDGTCTIVRYDDSRRTEETVQVLAEGLFLTLHAEARPALPPLKGRVVLTDKPTAGVADVALVGIVKGGGSVRMEGASDQQGSFTLARDPSDVYLHAATADGKLRGMVWVPADAGETVVPIGPTASVSGRVLDENGEVLAGRAIRFGLRMDDRSTQYLRAFGEGVTTGADGSFTIDGLVPGFDYQVTISVLADRRAPRPIVANVTPRRAELIELGDVKLAGTRD